MYVDDLIPPFTDVYSVDLSYIGEIKWVHNVTSCLSSANHARTVHGSYRVIRGKVNHCISYDRQVVVG